jgi:hypothetical protein
MVKRTKVNGTADRTDMEIGIRKRTLLHTGRAEPMGNEIEAAMNPAITGDSTTTIAIERPIRLGTIAPMATTAIMAMPDAATIEINTTGIRMEFAPTTAVTMVVRTGTMADIPVLTGRMDVTTTSRIRRTGTDFAMG